MKCYPTSAILPLTIKNCGYDNRVGFLQTKNHPLQNHRHRKSG